MVVVWSMTGSELSDRAEHIAENSFLKLIGRVGMASAFPVLVLMSTWVGNTLWSINAEQARLSARIDVLSERIGTSVIRSSDVDLGFKLRDQRLEYLEKADVEIRRMLTDHGTRILHLERK